MAVGEILAVADLCERVGKFGLALYNVSQNIADNFSQDTILLGRKVEALSQRVTLVRATLQDPKNVSNTKKLSGLNDVIVKIEKEFKKIDAFFQKLQEYGGIEGARYFINHVKKYKRIQREFEDFSCILYELDKKLGKRLQDCTMVVVLETNALVKNLGEEQENQGRDLQKILDKIGTLPDAILEKFTRQQKFIKGRFGPGSLLPNPIKPSEISDKKFLCQGSYCKFYTAVLDREKVIVKQIEDVNDQNVKQSFAKETRNLMMISSGSITRLFGACDEETEKFLVMEYMERGSLSRVLHSGEKLTLGEMVTLASSAAKSVYRIHTVMVHTALRTEKFLVDKMYTAKLSGMSHAMTFSSCRRYKPTTPPHVDISFYRAPELFEPNSPTQEADIYGFGIVLWEIFTQTKPFSTLEFELKRKPTISDLEKFIVNDKREEYLFGDQSNPIILQLNQLIRKCRSLDPKSRPTISDIEATLSKIEEEVDQ